MAAAKDESIFAPAQPTESTVPKEPASGDFVSPSEEELAEVQILRKRLEVQMLFFASLSTDCLTTLLS